MYEPLLFLDRKGVQISPVPLNEGEWHFVRDLQRFHAESPTYFAGKKLYLLRNQSKGRGLGFFEAGNFHPDFILWLVGAGQQQILFVDPKGIRNLGENDPKIRFRETIKEIERRLGDPSVRLESFIVSDTPWAKVELTWATSKDELQKEHVLFQEETDYVRAMLQMVVEQR
ncbi:MAG: hypothetical protein ACM3ZA_11265 [Bacillota bacterium]